MRTLQRVGGWVTIGIAMAGCLGNSYYAQSTSWFERNVWETIWDLDEWGDRIRLEPPRGAYVSIQNDTLDLRYGPQNYSFASVTWSVRNGFGVTDQISAGVRTESTYLLTYFFHENRTDAEIIRFLTEFDNATAFVSNAGNISQLWQSRGEAGRLEGVIEVAAQVDVTDFVAARGGWDRFREGNPFRVPKTEEHRVAKTEEQWTIQLVWPKLVYSEGPVEIHASPRDVAFFTYASDEPAADSELKQRVKNLLNRWGLVGTGVQDVRISWHNTTAEI